MSFALQVTVAVVWSLAVAALVVSTADWVFAPAIALSCVFGAFLASLSS